MNDQSRSSTKGMTANQQQPTGVGGRQDKPHLPDVGGGYLDICTSSDSPVQKKNSPDHDPRIDELRHMGLPNLWITVADRVGFDAFMVLWQTLDGSPSELDDLNRAYIPKLNRWTRYQRNKFIASLSSEGLAPKDIKSRVETDLCESITASHIMRIISRSKKSLQFTNE